MKFIFSYHAQYRMNIREISALDIKDTINYTDFTEIQNNGKILKIKNIAEKGRVAVVYRAVGNKFIIITAYYEN